MSASPSTSDVLVRGSETTLRAITGLMHRSKLGEIMRRFNAHIDLAAERSEVDWLGQQRLSAASTALRFVSASP